MSSSVVYVVLSLDKMVYYILKVYIYIKGVYKGTSTFVNHEQYFFTTNIIEIK